MPEPKEERINEQDMKNLRESIEAVQAAQDALDDLNTAHTRFTRKLAVTHELRGRDSIDAFGYIIREKRT